MNTLDLPLIGGCQCGAVRYRIASWPKTLYWCHCTECQRQAWSAFGMSLRVARDGFEVNWSTMDVRVRDRGLPTEVHGYFCRHAVSESFTHDPAN